eukprot:1143089-Pelagomonas_calceolata.AAC.13
MYTPERTATSSRQARMPQCHSPQLIAAQAEKHGWGSHTPIPKHACTHIHAYTHARALYCSYAVWHHPSCFGSSVAHEDVPHTVCEPSSTPPSSSVVWCVVWCVVCGVVWCGGIVRHSHLLCTITISSSSVGRNG